MLDPIIEFFSRMFYVFGRGVGQVVAWLLWPFLKLMAFYRSTGFLWKAVIGVAVLGLVLGYGWFGYNAMTYRGYNPDYVEQFKLEARKVSAGEEVQAAGGATTTKTCGRSAIVDVAAHLTDFNVNQNSWMSSMLTYKSGFFGMSWDRTPFLDNKASFQRGVHTAVQRVSNELVDSLGRVRGTSQIDPDLQKARGQLQYDMSSWYFGLSPFGFKQATPSSYRIGIEGLNTFNARLASCGATFDARADNLSALIEVITSQIGSTTAAIDERSRNNNLGWFDTQADNHFWEAMGQLYAYYGFVSAAHADFEDVIRNRSLDAVWNRMEEQLRLALDLDPFIVSNGSEDGWIMPTHLTTLGFKILRVRSNLVEARDILRQ
ncbi:MAG: DUF2333 family protein [Rhizobiaceae bacterium]